VQDCYDEKAYVGKAPSDGRAYEVAGCSSRSLRGGGWVSVPAVARSANRDWFAPDDRYYGTGLRVARMLP
jgi:formylglycine-generating enzyme required for sulfatase activity